MKRKQDLKEEYIHIDTKEKQRLENDFKKLQTDQEEVNKLTGAFRHFFDNFDKSEDFNKNTENVMFYEASFDQLNK